MSSSDGPKWEEIPSAAGEKQKDQNPNLNSEVPGRTGKAANKQGKITEDQPDAQTKTEVSPPRGKSLLEGTLSSDQQHTVNNPILGIYPGSKTDP